MKPSALRMRAISIFMRLDGIITFSWRAVVALRIRVSMSATGSFTVTPRLGRAFGSITRRGRGASVAPSGRAKRGAGCAGVVVVVTSDVIRSPTALRHAGELADERALAEADPAQTELAHVPAGPAAHLAAVVPLGLELRGLLRLEDQAQLRHLAPPLRGAERHAERLQQRAAFFVRLRRGHDRDLEPAQPVDLVVLDLPEHELLLEAERVVAAAVEAALRDALEVTDPRERDRDELLEEVPHPRSAQRHLEADRHADPKPEVRDGLPRLRDHGPLAGDDREVVRGGIHRLRVADRLAHPDVQDDLVEPRDLHDVAVAELLAQLVLHGLLVALAQQVRHLRHDAVGRRLRSGRRGLPLRGRGLRRGRFDFGRHQSFPSLASAWPQTLQKRSLVCPSMR